MVFRRAVGMLFVLLMIPSLSSGAPSPRAEIKSFFERAKVILSEATGVRQARAEFRGVTHVLFDGRAGTRQALGTDWNTRTTAGRDQFARPLPTSWGAPTSRSFKGNCRAIARLSFA